MKSECRYLQEVRLAGDGKKPVITGYASVFNSRTDIGGQFWEVVRPGAFTRALKEGADVRALIDHDPSRIVGRSKSGTLRLAEDERGLRVEIDPPDTTIGRDLVENLRRGDLDQMSFRFSVPSGGDKWTRDGGRPFRELTDLNLMDVSIVTFPAYDATSVSVRSLFPDGEVEIPEDVKVDSQTSERANEELARKETFRKIIEMWLEE